MAERPRYLIIAVLGCAFLAAIACTFAMAPNIEIMRRPIAFMFQYVLAPSAETIAFSFAFYLLFGLTRYAMLRVIDTTYRVLFSTLPGAGKLTLKQDGLLWVAPDHQIRYLAI